VLPKLEQDTIVLVDRCIDSTIAYQGYGKQVGISFLEHLNPVATKGREPDLTILLDIEAESALNRKEGDLDRMEQLDLLRSARAAYISLSTRHAHRIKVIQAEEPVHDIHSKIVYMVKKIIGP
jgi:dTMP kinase